FLLSLPQSGWCGPTAAIEFGYFDRGPATARAIRLSPPPFDFGALESGPALAAGPMAPLLLAATSAATGVSAIFAGGVAAFGAAFAATEVFALLMYSAFPGYPGLFDLPVQDGLLTVPLPNGGAIAAPDGLLPVWP